MILNDLRFALRLMKANPGFTAIAVVTLALGIGANTAIFSAVNGMLFQSVPFPERERLVYLGEHTEQIPNMSVSYPNFLDWRERNRSFEGLAAARVDSLNLTGLDRPQVLAAALVSANLFPVLGVEPMLGRAFTEEEDQPGGEAVTLVTHRFWQAHLGGDPDAVGRTLVLDGDPYVVTGVMPPGFHYPLVPVPYDLVMPIGHFAERWVEQRGNHPGIYVTGRLKQGVSMDQARADLDSIAAALAEQYPDSNTGHGIAFMPLVERVAQFVRPALLVLMGAVALVLLIACVNVANLLLARGSARRQEIALRSALGSGRWRLVRQMLTESVLLALLAAVAGLVVAQLVLRALFEGIDGNLLLLFGEIAIDRRVLLYTGGLAILTGFVFGLFPALQLLRVEPGSALKEGGRGSASGRGRLRGSLVIAEMALAMVLLIGAVLLVQSFRRLVAADMGFDESNVLTMRLALPPSAYPEPQQQVAFYDQLAERVRGLPGVESATTTMPLLGGWQNTVLAEGQPAPAPGQSVSADIARVGTDYFRTLDIGLVRGRTFSDDDREGSVPVAVVDETFAQAFWPGEQAVGRRIKFGDDPGDEEEPWWEIVGVVQHVKSYGAAQPSRIEIYTPVQQDPVSSAVLVVKTRGEPRELALPVEGVVRELDANQPVTDVRTLEERVGDSLAAQQLATGLLGFFSTLALTLAAIGIYGVMAYTVVQRRREVGLRMSLGATSSQVLGMFLLDGLKLVAAGIAVGMALAVLGAPVLSSQLFGIEARDPATFLVLPLVLVAVATAASVVPALRASRVPPARVLHYE
jgi:putative ABC transport system permease protein